MSPRDLKTIAGLVALAVLGGCSTQAGQTPAMSLAPGATPTEMGSADDSGGTDVNYDDNASSAGRFAWTCDNGDIVKVDNTVTSITVGMPDGSVMQMPATPADSRTRYVVQQYALVFDGDEALFFRPKAAPLTCKKGVALSGPIVQNASIDLRPGASDSGG